MRRVDWRDDEGRIFRSVLPDGVPDSEARRGVPVGPPDLSGLGLPQEIEIRLNNQLHSRGIFTFNDARRRITEIVAALQWAYRADAQRVTELYAQEVIHDD